MADFATKLMCLFLILGLAAPSLATEYVIGGPAGWDLNVDLSLWLNGKIFKVGDVFVFNYDPKLHNLVRVDLVGFTTCLPLNILSIDTSGKTIITLDKPGVFYYISSLFTDCLSGLKIKITVL
ncbi:basic blue protein-like [Lycium ferocissimum]|uniref:basic blue protein-like n=1 Tax=Lycium ferocissimum TaxID=112874 RepID=UPI002814A8C3|nr:basic blue protein-like [Lycium ferocissimum]